MSSIESSLPPQLVELARKFAKVLVAAVRDELSAGSASNKSAYWLTPKQAATLLNVSPATVRDWCRTGKLGKDISQPGSTRKKWVIHRQQLDQFLQSSKPASPRTNRRSRRTGQDVIEFF